MQIMKDIQHAHQTKPSEEMELLPSHVHRQFEHTCRGPVSRRDTQSATDDDGKRYVRRRTIMDPYRRITVVSMHVPVGNTSLFATCSPDAPRTRRFSRCLKEGKSRVPDRQTDRQNILRHRQRRLGAQDGPNSGDVICKGDNKAV